MNIRSEPSACRILGIDPGSQRTGFGIIDVDAAGKLTHVHHGALAVADEETFPLRLKRIFDGLAAIIEAHQPAECGIERVFMARNPDSALKLGQARGAAICAVAAKGLAVHEYAPTEIKQAVVGSGRGDKTQVQHMVGILLGLKGPLQPDAADALAIAVTHAHTRASLARVGIPRTAWRRR
ncbi:crossover junction endodeoxyribonuclease RuvC [Frateuria edaphi]|jgi:crossover junction endodeoxyribonuclease RuvC|uniref:crossover junction endodeoxyribonuclease RuvC n=1 Tax=Frateuria TaxID=70411 RepID=UPI001E4109F0|nr:crossover junction endodeoxyribonuclease RuvC [Frateuria edaphi]UGB46208.1 crossover junction endodeoxyribonuclease RuvC [Frateuria edaphi]